MKGEKASSKELQQGRNTTEARSLEKKTEQWSQENFSKGCNKIRRDLHSLGFLCDLFKRKKLEIRWKCSVSMCISFLEFFVKVLLSFGIVRSLFEIHWFLFEVWQFFTKSWRASSKLCNTPGKSDDQRHEEIGILVE